MADRKPLSSRDIRAARRDSDRMRPRDLADSLGISEAELLAAHVGHGTTRIDAHPDRLMPAVDPFGEVLAITRTPSCVHEKRGAYHDYHSGDHAAMVLAEEIDLRIFPRHWVHAFAVDEAGEAGPRRTLQVFDAAGDAVHKVFLRPESDHSAWGQTVRALALPDQVDHLRVEARRPVEPARPRADRAVELRARWTEMTDTHQFLGLASKLRMNRLGAYRVAGAPHARALAPSALVALFEGLAGSGIAPMVFVGNQGCIQIHSGPIGTVRPTGPWFNILDPGFNLHLRADHVAEVWAVEKPTRRGTALSVEAFDAEGALILQCFAVRKPGNDHGPAFAKLVAGLPVAAPRSQAVPA